MARQLVTPSVAGGTSGYDLVPVEFVGSTIADGWAYVSSGREVVMVRNGTGGSAIVSVLSAPNEFGRQRTLTISIAAGTRRLTPVIPHRAWARTGNQVFIDTDTDGIAIAVISLPWPY